MAPPSETALPDTPVMRQYQEIKNSQPDSILFFRLGDFYEMFGSDARAAAPLMGLVLTSRQGVPMCGIPYHQSQGYIAKLLKAGHKVAIAEQMEEPSKTKKLVRREVIRLITPGTLIEDSLLEPTATNFLVAIEHDIVGWGAACIDVSTGEFWATQALNDRDSRRLFDLLARLRPAEVLAQAKASQDLNLKQALGGACLTLIPAEDGRAAAPWMKDAVWVKHHLAARAASRCRAYVAESRFHLRDLLAPSYRESASEMQLDDTAIRTLELVDSASGERKHSLWGLLNRCRTPMGSRKLRHWILHPSTDLSEIELRQNCVEDLYDKSAERRALADALGSVSDLPRVISRLTTRQAGPRDLGALRLSLAQLPGLVGLLTGAKLCPGLETLAERLEAARGSLAACEVFLGRALVDEPPARLSDGRLIRAGYHAELDELYRLKNDSRGFLESLEETERRATGIGSLKAGYNSVFGYYFEVTKTHSAKVPARYTRKQTLTNAERYITPELKELENRILGSEEKILRLEAKLFEEVREEVLRHHDMILRLGGLLAELDVFIALAECASLYELVKPKVDLSYELDIVDGRHPVLCALLASGSFVPNSLKLDSEGSARIIILTGPNMSGKSTYLRQNALIAVMAQIGSFVPARSARLGIVDKILTRIGAQDALAQGASTFMVEMKETSHILRGATARSLVILDEVGRGTSTFDGISIAWAVIEHLHQAYARPDEKGPKGPRVLFATHYFELTEIAQRLPGVENHNVEAKEWTDSHGKTEVVFLHKISPGPADRSYGIHVAALAGLPTSLLARAREILAGLERQSVAGGAAKRAATAPELPLFEEDPVLQSLRLLDCDAMTPLEALAALSALKKKL
jgi:DNA mismatch repair protein MutS